MLFLHSSHFLWAGPCFNNTRAVKAVTVVYVNVYNRAVNINVADNGGIYINNGSIITE